MPINRRHVRLHNSHRATLTQPRPPRARALARGTIACASSTDPPPPAPPPAARPCRCGLCTCRSPAQPRRAGGGTEARELRLTVSVPRPLSGIGFIGFVGA